MKPPLQPSRILMLKGHSAGIGDILRSSAAWRVLKNAYPQAELHLMFLTREPGYVSEGFIREHHLLSGFVAIDKRTKTLGEWRRFWSEVNRAGARVRPDLIIDFESNGVRTSLMAAWLGLRWGARTIGIRTAPGRGLFYGRAAAPARAYASRHGLVWPLDYTERDFVALSALGLTRAGCPIELRETAEGRQARLALRRDHGLEETTRLLGVNIGCGTPEASPKRPDLGQLSELAAGLERDHGLRLVLVGAPFERAVNEEFCALHRQRSAQPIINLAGATSVSGLTGVVNACALFISSDSGPYHIGVAMRVPTLALFRWENRVHYHAHPWVRCCLAGAPEQGPLLRQAAEELWHWGEKHSRMEAGARAGE